VVVARGVHSQAADALGVHGGKAMEARLGRRE